MPGWCIILIMKLIMAVIQDSDADRALAALTKAGYRVTRVASTGGFFRTGNTTLLCGTEDNQVDAALDILRATCQKRTSLRPISIDPTEPLMSPASYTEVETGGATIFVFNVERYEQL